MITQSLERELLKAGFAVVKMGDATFVTSSELVSFELGPGDATALPLAFELREAEAAQQRAEQERARFEAVEGAPA